VFARRSWPLFWSKTDVAIRSKNTLESENPLLFDPLLFDRLVGLGENASLNVF
jgi:hypothetical protein